MDENSEQLEGVLERIVYSNEDNNYTVARLKVQGHSELVTAVGNLAGVSVGETLSVTGAWVNHKKFGQQFRVDSFITKVPATIKGMERYLGSGLIKGIGPVMAKRLTQKFGLNTLDIIENKPRRLTEIEGLGPKKAESITNAWKQQKHIREVMVFLQGYDISATYAEKIYRVYGGSTISRVKEDPYCLAADIMGIGFKTADKAARSMGIPADSPKRAMAGIVYLLDEAAGEGHLYLPRQELLDLTREKLEIDGDITEQAILSLAADKRIHIENAFDGEESVYLAAHYQSENDSAKKLETLKQEHSQLPLLEINTVFNELEDRGNIQYTDNQKKAVEEALRQGVLVITGGPGTGKTTLIKAIVTVYQLLKIKIILAAPTGRAAKRLSEAAGLPAKTIHRLLEFNPARGGFQRDEFNPLQADAVIIDETSMLDIPLFHHLINAVQPGTRLILVGDVDQLPSVGPGSFLKDVINSGVFKVVLLKEIFRQEEESAIVLNAHRINQGEKPEYKRKDGGKSEFIFARKEEPEQVLRHIKELCTRILPTQHGWKNRHDVQVICPMNRGVVGTWNLNSELQNTLNPRGPQIVRGDKIFRLGDRVMQVQNNYDKDIFNGDLGKIAAVNTEDNKLLVDFEGQLMDYEADELDELALAYAVSVHKSQGSEYPVVVMPLVTQHFPLLQRNLLYTGISRAKKLVILVGQYKAMYIAINNDKVQQRYTHFMNRLKEAAGG